jgi:hypothetical protein
MRVDLGRVHIGARHEADYPFSLLSEVRVSAVPWRIQHDLWGHFHDCVGFNNPTLKATFIVVY